MENKATKLLKHILKIPEITVILIVILAAIILTLITPHFLTQSNIRTLFTGLSTDGIIVIGMTMILIIGEIDLSVGSIMGMVCMLVAVLTKSGTNVWLASAIAMAVGCACGAVNGILIGKVGLNGFITTLAMQGVLRGVTLLSTQGRSISPAAADKSYEIFRFIGQGRILSVPVIVIVLFVFILAGDFLLKKTTPFRQLYYVGSNAKGAALSGIDVRSIKIHVFILSAFLASVAGVISLARFGASTPTTGQDAPMTAISAAVIGGASLTGGAGTVIGAFLGVILIRVIDNGLILLNISVYGRDLVSGLLLITAILIDHLSNKKKIR